VRHTTEECELNPNKQDKRLCKYKRGSAYTRGHNYAYEKPQANKDKTMPSVASVHVQDSSAVNTTIIAAGPSSITNKATPSKRFSHNVTLIEATALVVYTRVNFRLPVIEQLISNLQQDIAYNSHLRAGKRWRENGETLASYLKRTIEARQTKRSIPSVQHPNTDILCQTPSAMDDAVSTFYSTLNTPSSIDEDSVQQFASTISDNDRLSTDTQSSLTIPFTRADIIAEAARCPRKSSPGIDGLPYEILLYSLIMEKLPY
jgi:hypothetical protein